MRRGRRPLLIAGVMTIVALAPAQAMAAGSARGTTAKTTSSPSAPPPPAGHALVYLPGTFVVHHQRVTVARRAVHVVAVVWPYARGQWIALRAKLGRRVIETRELRLHVAGGGKYGEVQASFASPAPGPLLVSVRHVATPKLGGFEVGRGLAALDPQVGFGSQGRFIELIQQRLASLHFYIPQTGTYDLGTALALDAYHRLLRWGTSQTLDGPTINALLEGLGSFKVRFPHHGRHAEGDLSLQLLALVSGSHVWAIYPISSGKPSTPTILGDFHVYQKDPGYLPDGMYYSNFFYGNYAIHGYDPAPDYPASHGCMRLPIVDATSVYGWLAIGDWVDVYS